MKQDYQGRKSDSFECQQTRRGEEIAGLSASLMPVDLQKRCYRLIIKHKN